eukprot:scaffold87233_cov66-Phaeocystis_antarctica.AAC.2
MVRGGAAAMRKGCASHSVSQCARASRSANASKKPRWQLTTARWDALNSDSHRPPSGTKRSPRSHRTLQPYPCMPGGHGERITPRIGTSPGVHAARAALSSSAESAKGAAAAAAPPAAPPAASPATPPDTEACPAANCATSSRCSNVAACCSASSVLSCASSAVRGDRSLAGPVPTRGFSGTISSSPGLPSSSSTRRTVQVADKTARAVVDIVGVGPQSPPLETPDDPSADKFARPLS